MHSATLGTTIYGSFIFVFPSVRSLALMDLTRIRLIATYYALTAWASHWIGVAGIGGNAGYDINIIIRSISTFIILTA